MEFGHINPATELLGEALLAKTRFSDAPTTGVVARVSIFQLTARNPMKPSITPKVVETGKKVLAFQYEGIEATSFSSALNGKDIVAYAMPIGHSFQAAWLFWLCLSGGEVLELSSACTQVVGWQEVGSLNIRFKRLFSGASADSELKTVPIGFPAMHLQALEKLVYEDTDVISECGLVLRGESGEEIVVAAGIPPGSVSVTASFASGPFRPQFAFSDCRRELL